MTTTKRLALAGIAVHLTLLAIAVYCYRLYGHPFLLVVGGFNGFAIVRCIAILREREGWLA